LWSDKEKYTETFSFAASGCKTLGLTESIDSAWLCSLARLRWSPLGVIPDSFQQRCHDPIMPALHRALLLAPMLSFAYEPLSRRRIAGLAAASLAPRVARADEPAVDAEMLANIQKSRDAWKTNAARRGFAFEAGASMPFVKEDTVGAPDRSAPVHKFRSASPHARAPDHWLICAQVRTLDLRRSAAEEQTGDPQRSACRGRGVGPARRLGRGHGRLGPRGLLRQR